MEEYELNSNSIFERRKFVRIDGTFVVSYSDVRTPNPKTDITQTKNISTGGILFTTDRLFAPGTILRLRLRLPDSADYINIKVQVVGSNPLQKGRSLLHETRVKFTGMREEDREAIKRIVELNLEK